MNEFLRTLLMLLLALAGLLGLAVTACSGIFLIGGLSSSSTELGFVGIAIVCLLFGCAVLFGVVKGFQALGKRRKTGD